MKTFLFYFDRWIFKEGQASSSSEVMGAGVGADLWRVNETD